MVNSDVDSAITSVVRAMSLQHDTQRLLEAKALPGRNSIPWMKPFLDSRVQNSQAEKWLISIPGQYNVL